MSLLTLRRFLDGSSLDPAFVKMISVLLQAMSGRPVQTGDESDRENFQRQFQAIQEQMEAASTADDMLVACGAARQALDDYNHRASRFIRQQAAELQNMISMLTGTVIDLSSGSDQAIARLRGNEQQLERAADIEDVQLLRSKLGDCLKLVREEAERQKMESQKEIERLKRGVAEASSRVDAARENVDIDEITTLPGPAAAERAFAEALATPGRKYIVTMVVSRVQAINARFGYAAGNEVINAWRDHVQRHLSGRDRLFRWRGPALVGLLERRDAIDAVRSEVGRFASKPLEWTLETANRSVLIPISAGWSVVGLLPPAAGVAKHIETFVATQVPREYC